MGEYFDERFDVEDPSSVSAIDELPLWSAPFGMRLLERLRLRRGMNVLDIGPGTGFPLLEIAQRLGPTGKVFGVDPWMGAVRRIRLKAGICRVDNAMPVVGVGEDMPFADSVFDLVVSNNGTNNVADVERTFSESFRVSRPGAQLVIAVNLKETMIEFYDLFERLLRERGMDGEVARMKRHIYSMRRPIGETVSSIEGAGFSVDEIINDRFKIGFVDGTAMLNHFLIRLAFLRPWKEVLEAGDREEIFGRIENRLNSMSGAAEGFALTVPFAILDCRRRG